MPNELPIPVPKTHHLDRYADQIAADAVGDPDDLLSTIELAAWLRCSVQFLEIGRSRGYGPRYVRLSPRRTRYLRSDVLEWLRERTHRLPNTCIGKRPMRRNRRAGPGGRSWAGDLLNNDNVLLGGTSAKTVIPSGKEVNRARRQIAGAQDARRRLQS